MNIMPVCRCTLAQNTIFSIFLCWHNFPPHSLSNVLGCVPVPLAEHFNVCLRVCVSVRVSVGRSRTLLFLCGL